VPVDAKSIHPRKRMRMLISREGVVLTRFRGEGLMLAGASTLKNEHTWLVFEGGENVEVGTAQLPSFRRVEGVVLAMSSHHRK